ncbi:hypothetical protein COX95_02285 [bacterium CG_4_10_14_0_2_um_filter_33_32]|nr:MAG: hypothetical protein AUJ93_04640 [bacterium CG2_30_33_46]PIR67666.1 MAG: hypothetical protein COU50_02090 [bacterium CG10_big_fil_rev_8_21_14_0_10_33_18]PIY85758.1 MAG: hypothetical protein COY76_00485 [bacterium CG_4_10_14_0_8_um_filter_33_57]PIZ86065.1 MAG: hypothetical protein COX95_02285 [bacterium CG_4_10_14_0_2_um_filter_33_32]
MENNEDIRQLLYQISNAVSKLSLDMDDYLSVIKETIMANLGVDNCLIFIDRKKPDFADIIDFIKNKKETLLVFDIQNNWRLNFKSPFKAGSLVISPILLENKVIGLVIVHWKKPKLIKQYELEVLRLVSSQVASAVNIHDLHNKVVSQRDKLKSVVSDLSDKLQTIKMQEQRWHTFFQTVDIGMIIYDSEGIIIDTNPEFCRLSGFEKEELKGHLACESRSLYNPFSKTKIGNFCPAMEIVKRKRIHKSQIIKNDELWLKQKNGEFKWVSVSAYSILDNFGKLVLIVEIIRDIDKLKKIEKEREDFITSATHELRTPLTAVRGYMSMILNNKGLNEENKTRYLERAYTSSEEIMDLVERMLEIIRIKSDKSSIKLTTIDLIELINDVIVNLNYNIEKTGISVKKDFTTQPVFASSDYKRLKIVISGIIDNAIKYSGGDSIIISLVKDHNDIIINIRDTGIGISEEDIENIFQRFYRVSDSLTSRVPGAGLGLYIARELANEIGGELSASSIKGEGTTFKIRIPLVLQLQLPCTK